MESAVVWSVAYKYVYTSTVELIEIKGMANVNELHVRK